MKVLVTGASGFVGRVLCQTLSQRGHLVTAALRSPQTPPVDGVCSSVVVGDIGPDTRWSQALAGQDSIIHLAARAHVMNEPTGDPERFYRQINVEGTRCLVKRAKVASISRLVFMSSVKVNGEETTGHAFSERLPAEPKDAYGRTKWAAEQIITGDPDMRGTIIRSPLVYGAGVKGNFLKLLRISAKGLPLPLGSIKNLRSLIYVENLVDALAQSLTNDRAIGQTFLVSDGEDISTPELFRRVASLQHKPNRIFSLPVGFLTTGGHLLGRSNVVQRLCGSLQVDTTYIRQQLSWKPPHTLQQGLEKTVDWFQNQAEPKIF